MTGVVGIFLGLVAAVAVTSRWRAITVVVVPFLAVLGLQTYSIASGRASSPPSTVQYPGLFGYYVVQVIILALALGAADQLRMRIVTSHRASVVDDVRRTWIAFGLNLVVSALVAVAFYFGDGRFAVRVHHSAQGGPPVVAVFTVGLSAVVFAGCGLANLRARRALRRRVLAS